MGAARLAEIELPEEMIPDQDADDLAYLITVDSMASGWPDDEGAWLPELCSIPVGTYLAAVLEHTDRSKLNGYDVVRLLQARERQLAHYQADSMADTVEMAYAAPGDADSEPRRLDEQFEYAADELRPALTLSRRAAQYRLSFASDLLERLPKAWAMLHEGLIDLPKARAFANGTAHLPEDSAREIVERLADSAPRLTVGQLKYRIRRLCLEIDPEDARRRERDAHAERRLVIEPTVDGTADLHLYGLSLGDARSIGRRVNGYMISLKREDRSGRTHDQLRADIATDLLLGGEASGGGRGLVDIHVPVATLDGGSEPGEIGGLGPVSAETTREIVAGQPEAEHQITLVDEHGNPTHVFTLSRRATRRIRRHMEALQPRCSFPGCLSPATDCDFDHVVGWAKGGETSTTNGSPKCDHDHQLKDQGWSHRRQGDEDVWVSRLGHSYVTQGQSP